MRIRFSAPSKGSAAFYADAPQHNTLRLSFVTVAPAQITRGIELLAQALKGVAR